MRLEVINVGDGACAAASCCFCSEELTLIDCGTHPRSKVAARPGAAAAQHLGGRLARLTTMVVTHFDSDHWGGLRELVAPYTRHQRDQREIHLYYPGMPVWWATSANDRGNDLLAAMRAVSRLISIDDDEPVSAIALRDAWRGVAVVKHSPLYRGQGFTANGHEWMVHWPPRRLSATRGRRFERWLERVRQVADDMAEDRDHPYPRLRDQLEEAYQAVQDLFGDEEALIDSNSPGWIDLDDAEGPPDDAIGDDDLDPGGSVGHEDPPADELPLDHIPHPHRERVEELAAGLKGIDNYLSLVVSAGEELICFGDIEGSALGELRRLSAARTPDLAGRYDLMLAPHHGSHDTHAAQLPEALFCVSQNGSWLEQYNHKHLNRHLCNSLSTWHHGSMDFDLCWSSSSPPCCRHHHGRP